MKHILYILISALVVTGNSSVWAFDTAAGGQLIENDCTSCHRDEYYTRENRMVTTRPGLAKQVRICTEMVGVTWFDEDIDNASEYLNQQFYHFGK